MDFVPAMVGADGIIRGPADDGRAAVVAQDDIADVAVAVLARPSAHIGATHDITGPEALSLAEVAEILSRVEGPLRRARLAGRCLGQHIHRHRRR